MQNSLKIIGIQANLVWENKQQNLLFFERKINKLPPDVHIIVLPEMFTTGFTMKPANIAEKITGTTVVWMQKIAKEKEVAICGSLVISEHNAFYNMFVFVHPSGKLETYTKRHSFTLANEDKVYTSGKEKLIINYKGWKLCPIICYDLRFPVWIRNTENYDLLICVANWPKPRIMAWQTLLKARAIENMCYTIGVNRTGIDINNNSYSGASLIIDFLGEELANLRENEIGFVEAIITKKTLKSVREKYGFLGDIDTFKVEL